MGRDSQDEGFQRYVMILSGIFILSLRYYWKQQEMILGQSDYDEMEEVKGLRQFWD